MAPTTPPVRYTPGSRVRVTQQIPRPANNTTMATTIEGTVERYEQSKTGSWYAHAKGDKLWLDRLIIKKDDGETVHLNLDQYSLIELIERVGN